MYLLECSFFFLRKNISKGFDWLESWDSILELYWDSILELYWNSIYIILLKMGLGL